MKKFEMFFVSIFAVLLACFSLGFVHLGDIAFAGVVIPDEKPSTGGSSTGTKGGAIIIESGATYTMEGGEILSSSADSGGAIFVSSGATLNMRNGTIRECSATYGGAVYVESGATFNMYGGTISGCSATSGGAVYVCDGGTFNMLGGDISGCLAETSGGGIFAGGKVEINEGNILSCEAPNGGSIYVESEKSELTLTSGEANGEIYNAGTLNFVDFSGPKIFLKDSSFITFKAEPKQVVNVELETSASGIVVAKLDGIDSFDLTLLSVSNMPENTSLGLENGEIKIMSKLCKVTIVPLDADRYSYTISKTEAFIEPGTAVGWEIHGRQKTTIFLLTETIEITTTDNGYNIYTICGLIGEKGKYFGGFLNGYIVESDITIYIQRTGGENGLVGFGNTISFKVSNASHGKVSKTSIEYTLSSTAGATVSVGADEPYRNDKIAVINDNSFYIDGDEVVATPNDGYRFVGWYLNNKTLVTNKQLFSGDVSVTARFEAISSFKSNSTNNEKSGQEKKPDIIFDNKKFFSQPIKEKVK